MQMKSKRTMSRRSFMKLSAAAAAATAGGSPRVLYALVSGKESNKSDLIRNQFSACDMCFNKCGLIARVQDGVDTATGDMDGPSAIAVSPDDLHVYVSAADSGSVALFQRISASVHTIRLLPRSS